jgi:hypothetical protein
MMRNLWLAAAILAVSTTGCVEQRFLVTSEVAGLPPGQDAAAIVYVNGEYRGPTPADYPFIYYGEYHITLVKDGYETLQVAQPVPAPWYEWPPLDFFTETVNPFKVRDVRQFHYALLPLQSVRPEDVLMRGEKMRGDGKTVQRLPDSIPQVPKPAPPPKPVPPPTPPPGTPPDSTIPLPSPRVVPPGQ